MKFQIETSSYNQRRYGRPWIAKVMFVSASKADFIFGEWCGQQGSAGILEIDMEVGQIFAKGQKDFRKEKNSAAAYYIFHGLEKDVSDEIKNRRCSHTENGFVFELMDKKDAYLLSQKK